MTEKRKRAAYTTAQKVWLIELTERDPSLSTAEPGPRLAENVNDDRSRDLQPDLDEVCRKINIQTLQKKKQVGQNSIITKIFSSTLSAMLLR